MNKLVLPILRQIILKDNAPKQISKTITCAYTRYKHPDDKCIPCPDKAKPRKKIVRAKTCTQCTFWEDPIEKCDGAEKPCLPFKKEPIIIGKDCKPQKPRACSKKGDRAGGKYVTPPKPKCPGK